MFEDKYRRDIKKLNVRKDLLMEIKKKHDAKKRKNIITWSSVAAAAVACILCLTIFIPGIQANETSVNNITAEVQTGEIVNKTTFSSHKEVFDYIENLNDQKYGALADGAMAGEDMIAEEPAEEEVIEETAAEEAAPAEGSVSNSSPESAEAPESSAEEYSETNKQVKDVDEADIVKTDGEYIYYMADNTFRIAKADGENTEVLSSTQILSEEEMNGENSSIYNTSEMFLAGDKVYIIMHGYEWTLYETANDVIPFDSEKTYIKVVDVSDKNAPDVKNTFSQTGYYVSSRMCDGTIYLISSCYMYRPIYEYPETYIPYIATDTQEEPIGAEHICVAEDAKDTSYTVITAYDAATGERKDEAKAVLGGAEEIYMNSEYLLVAVPYHESNTTDIHKDSTGKNVQITNSYNATDLVLYSLDGGIEFISSGRVEGSILNQFSMDIQGDVIRIVTSLNKWEQRIYTDGIDTYEYDDESTNGLYTLDTNMNVLGSITGLAKDEYIESVRFDGNIAYFVTFRQVDPLFCVDLSDPTAPKLLDSLKIPGFSEYMHKYGEGRLLGIGYNADEETGETGCVKLSMFDTSDKTNLKELHVEMLEEAYWTIVGSNHKAALIDAEKNIIAFPAENNYYIMSYTDENGFLTEKRLEFNGDAWSLRGLYIGEYLYIVHMDGIEILSMSDLSEIKSINF